MRDQMNKNAEVRKLTEQYGTKMAYLIFYLKQLMRDDPNSRVIIFSQVLYKAAVSFCVCVFVCVCVCLSVCLSVPPFFRRDRRIATKVGTLVWINLVVVRN